MELESLPGRMPFFANLHFWEVWLATTQPLYRKLCGRYYDRSISEGCPITSGWRSGHLKALRPRTISPRTNSPCVVIVDDATTSAMIMASVVFRKWDFDPDSSVISCKGVASDPGWAECSTGASLIYGLGRTALVLTTAYPHLPPDGLCINYIDNNNAKCALIKGVVSLGSWIYRFWIDFVGIMRR